MWMVDGVGDFSFFFFSCFGLNIPTSSILSTSGPPGSWITIAFIIFFQWSASLTTSDK